MNDDRIKVNVVSNQNSVELTKPENKVIVTDKKQDTSVNVVQKETSVVTVVSKGPKGDRGEQASLTGLNLALISTGSVTASVNVGNDTFKIQSGSSTFLFVSSSGRVGIATSTPTNTLQVNGGITATSFTGSFSGSFRAPGSNNQIIVNSNGVLGATSNISVNNAGVSNLLTANFASITNTLHVVGLNTSNGPTLIVGDGSDNATYYAIIPKIFTSKTLTKAYSIEQIEVGGKSIASFGIVEKQAGEDPNSEAASKTPILSLTEDKRVGIGTISPEKTLDVIGSVRISGGNTLENIGPAIFSGSITQPINNTSSLGILNVKSTSVLDGTVGVGTSLGGSKLRVKGTGASSATTALRIENSNDTAAFVVLDNGTVGVGMSNPNPVYNIQTNGTAYFANTIYTGGGNVSWNNIYGDGTTHILSGRSVGFITDNNNPTLKMLIRSDGRIGVGTTSPIAKLHISGGVNERLFIISSSLGPSLFVSGSGNVGIGTTSPTERLHVDGNLLVTGRITAEEFHTSLVSASIVYQSGSTQFGDTLDDTHQFTGSLRVKGNSVFDGSLKFEPTQDPDLLGLDTDSTILFQSSSNTSLGYDLYFRQNGNLVKWKWVEGMLESGLLYGGVVTYSGSNVFVSPGSGITVDHNAITGSEVGPLVDYVTWGPITQSITNIATQQVTYIYIDNNGQLQQQSTRFTSQQYHDYIPLGAVGHFNNSSVTAFGGQVQTSYDQVSQILNFVDAFGPLKMSGYGITGQPSSLRLSVASGISFIHGGFYSNDPQFPSQITTNAQLTASIAYVYRSGSGVRFDTNNNNFYTSVRPGFYDVGTGVTGSVSNNNWTIQRVYSDPKTGILYIYYGQNIYPNYQNALSNLSTDSFTEGDTFDFTTFLGFLVLKSNTSDITNTTDNKIIPAGLFRGSGQGGGGGSTVSNLDDLTDVTITSPTNGQTLVYNSGVWQNGTPLSSSYSITASFALNVDGGFY